MIMVKIAVVGCGYWGKNLVRNFAELQVLDAICDTDRVRLAQYSRIYPETKLIDSYDALLDLEELRGVVISTPARTHYPMVKKALEAGKDVFVEKPLALSVKEGEELVRLAADRSKTLMVGHILNYHPAVIRLKELIDNGELGKIEYLYSNRLNIGKLRQEENILWSFAPHDISVILMLLNELPVRISSFGGKYLQEGIYDTTMTTLGFASGVKAHIFVSWLHPFKEQKLVVVGNKKMAVFDDLSEERLFLYPHTIEWKERIPIARKEEREVIPLKMEEPLKAECQHFVRCLKEGLTPKTDGCEGLNVLRILSLAEESLRQDGKVITSEEGQRGYFVHPSSYIDEGVQIGEGTQIWCFSHVLKGARIGKDCKIGQNVVVGSGVIIGDNCKIQNNVSVYEGVMLEDYVFCGPSMVFTNVLNPRSEIPRMKEARETLVKRGTTIGANATIVCGNTIGRYAFIGAGAVVTRDVPDYALVMGNPARQRGWICRCGVKLDLSKEDVIRCTSCGDEYELKDGRLDNI